jgi:hypothetical protein
MTLDLVLRLAEDKPAILNPLTGAVVPLHVAATDEIAEAVDALGALQSQIREAQALASNELLDRMDKRGKWTANVGPFTLKSQSPTSGTTDYDAEPLRADLLKLVDAGVLAYEAVNDAVELVDPPKPDPYLKKKPAGIAALLKLAPRVVEVVERHRVEKPAPARKVTVKRRQEAA